MPRKACKHLQTLGRGRKHSPYRFREHGPASTLDFRLLASRTVRGQISVVLSHPVMVHQGFFGSLRK